MAPDEPPAWSADDLAVILRHQLAVPLEFELADWAGHPWEGAGDEPPPPPRRVEDRTILRTTFQELLHHPRPPLEMLRRVKAFAKFAQAQPSTGVPVEVATVLYFAAIVVAMMRCGTSLTTLPPDRVSAGVAWALDQAWLDGPTRELFADANRWLDGREGPPAP
jgi:hypothetical protein